MRFRTWPVAAVGARRTAAARRRDGARGVLARAQEIYAQVDQLNAHSSRRRDANVRRLRPTCTCRASSSATTCSTPRANGRRVPAAADRVSGTNMGTLAELGAGAGGEDGAASPACRQAGRLLGSVRAAVRLDAAEKIRRRAPASCAGSAFHAATRCSQSRRRSRRSTTPTWRRSGPRSTRQRGVPIDLLQAVVASLLLGAGRRLTAVIRLRILERRSEDSARSPQDAERQMRQLSQQLVATQEEERKKLSRELHDHVGQMLTALRMEIGRSIALRHAGERGIGDARSPSAGSSSTDMVRIVRDLALGLRPSMLDDFGLQPALEWHVRDFARRYRMTVAARRRRRPRQRCPIPTARASIASVQEALTNCVRHARGDARRRARARHRRSARGVGARQRRRIRSAKRRGGLGLRGIEERVPRVERRDDDSYRGRGGLR